MPVATATDIVSLETLREHLALFPAEARPEGAPNPDAVKDALLISHLTAAIHWVEAFIGRHLLDREFRLPVCRPGIRGDFYTRLGYFGYHDSGVFLDIRDDGAIRIPFWGVRIAVDGDGAITSPVIRYWETTQERNEDPTGVIVPARVAYDLEVSIAGASATSVKPPPYLYPPDGGWEPGLRDSPLLVEGRSGVESATDILEPWRMGILLATSAQWEDADRQEKYYMAARNLLSPWKAVGVA